MKEVDKMLLVPQDLLQEILTYLAEQPYKNVYKLASRLLVATSSDEQNRVLGVTAPTPEGLSAVGNE